MNPKRSTLLGQLEEPVRVMGSDEGVLLEATAKGLRIRTHLRVGDSGGSTEGQGSSGTDRSNFKSPRRW